MIIFLFLFFLRYANGNYINTGDQLAELLLNQTTDIKIGSNIVLNPGIWRETQTRIKLGPNQIYNIFSDLPGKIINIAPLSKLRSPPSSTLPIGSVDVLNNTTLNFYGIVYVCDVPLNFFNDLADYVGYIHLVDKNQYTNYISTNITLELSPLSDLKSFVNDTAFYFKNFSYIFIDDNNLLIQYLNIQIDMRKTTLYNCSFIRREYSNIYDGNGFMNLINQPYVRYINIINNINIPDNDNYTVINNNLFINGANNIIVDLNKLKDKIIISSNVLVLWSGFINIVNSIKDSILNEEAMLPIFSIQNFINDDNYNTGSLLIENLLIYGSHNPVFYTNNYALNIEDCEIPYYPTFEITSPVEIAIKRWQVTLYDVYQCYYNDEIETESFKRLLNITLRNGTYNSFINSESNTTIIIIILIMIVLIILIPIFIGLFINRIRINNSHITNNEYQNKLNDTAIHLFGKSCEMEFYQLLGYGSFGRVYKAYWYGQEVALKITTPFRNNVNEGILGEKLKHINIVETYSYKLLNKTDDNNTSSDPESELWIIQEYCNLGDISKSLNSNLFRDPNNNIPLMYNILMTLNDIAQAMKCLNYQKIIHCDLNCKNILLKSKQTNQDDKRRFMAKISDFGMISYYSNDSQTIPLGTLSHMAPEMISDGLKTSACDVYAFGIIMWELWSGKQAFEDVQPTAIAKMVILDRKRPNFDDLCPFDYIDLAKRCWSDNNVKRPKWMYIIEKISEMLFIEKTIIKIPKIHTQQ